MISNHKLTHSILLLTLILCTTNVVDGGRRISFGKRLTKPGSKGSKPSSLKDTTNEPEMVAVTVEMDMTMKCGGSDVKLMDEEHLTKCASVTGIVSKSDLNGDNISCFVKCLFERTKLVNENGILQRENLANFFATPLSSEIKEGLMKIFEKCLDDHGTKMNQNDVTCHTYGPLATCIHSAYADVCKQDTQIT